MGIRVQGLIVCGCRPGAGRAPHALRRGWLLALVLVLGMALWLARPAVATTQPLTLNWMGHWYKADKRYDLVLETAREFRFRNQHLRLNLQFPEQIFQTSSKRVVARHIAEMIRRGRIEWDVIWMDDHLYEFVAEELHDPLWGRKHLVNFEEVPGFAATQKPFIIQDPVYRNQTGGILVGPYIEGYYYALFYNKAVAARVGVKIKPYGMRFEDLLGYVQAVEAYNRRHPEAAVATFYEAHDISTMEILFQNLVKSAVGDFARAKAEDGPTSADLAALRRGLAAFEQLGRHRPLIASHASNLWFETRHLALEDKVLFFVSGTWMYSRWRDIDPQATQKMVPVELPVFRPVDFCLGGFIPTWAVMKAAPRRAEAIRLLLFWSTPHVAEKWVRYTKTPTGLRGDVSKATLGRDAYEEYQRTMGERYGARLHYAFNAGYLLGERNRLLHDELIQALRALLTGQTTAEAAYQALVRQLR